MRKLLLICCCLPFGLFAQLERAREVTKTLCSPEFQGRGYVNGGDSIAAEFIAAEYKKAGCKFFKQGIFQPFSFPVNAFPDRMSLTIDGKDLVPGVDFVVDPGSRGGTVIEISVVEITIQEIMDGTLLRDKLKLLLPSGGASGSEKAALINLSSLGGDTLKKARQLSEELTHVLTVLEVVNTKFTWSVASEQTLHPYFQVQQSALDVSKNSWKAAYSVDAVIRNHTARNVIAYAPAKKKSKKYLVYTAHYDHLGRMGQEAYFPGGNDNASGTAMLLELAHYFVQNPMDVNVVFMSFAGEEAGLIGSHYYVDYPLFPLKNISFLTNIDIMGSGEEGVTVVNATLFPKQFEVLTDINKKQEFLVKVGSRGPAANSDHYFFTEAGVPAFFLYTMGPNKHYHDVYDTYEELSFAEFTDIYQLLIDFGTCMPR